MIMYVALRRRYYLSSFACFFFNDTATTVIYTYLHTLSLHDALPISGPMQVISGAVGRAEIHFEAPPANRLPAEMDRFLAWLNDTNSKEPALLRAGLRSEEHTSELQSLMRISYAVFCLKKKTNKSHTKH